MRMTNCDGVKPHPQFGSRVNAQNLMPQKNVKPSAQAPHLHEDDCDGVVRALSLSGFGPLCQEVLDLPHLVAHRQPVAVGHLVALLEEVGVAVPRGLGHRDICSNDVQRLQPTHVHFECLRGAAVS